jgi:hypothetical protein
MLWILAGVAVLALVMFEFWPRKPGRAENGVDRIDGMDAVKRSIDRPRVPQPRTESGAAARRLEARRRR